MRRRTLVLAVCAWVALVVVASVATWTVIDSVGRDVLARGSVPAAAEWPSARPTRTPAGAPRPRRVPTPAPTGAAPTRGPAAAPSPSATATLPAAPSTPHPRAPRTPSGPRATRRPAPAAPAPPASEQGSWQGRAGTVVAECVGARISLRSATPNDGYRVETGSRGPQQVEVSFQGGDDRGQAQVTGVCRAGAPVFGAQTERGDD